MIIAILIILLTTNIIDFMFINKKIYSPIFIFNTIWFVSLGLYELKLSTLQQNLSDRTLIIFMVCILSYNIASIIAKYVKFKIPKKIRRKREGKLSVDEKVKIAKWIALILFIIQIIYSGGLPLIWKLTGDTRIYFDFGIASLTGAWYGLIICLGAYSCFKKGKDKYLYLLIGILILSRQIIISIILEAIFFSILDKKQKFNAKKMIIICLVLIVIFVGFNFLGNLRSGANAMNNLFNAKDEYKDLPNSIKWIYSYMTFSISNFNNLVSMTDGGVNYGISMLSEIIPTVIMNKINLVPNYNPYYLILINFNVSTYLPSIYLDFGIIGVAIFNILLAVLGNSLYNTCNKNNNLTNRLLYAVFMHNIVFLFFINMFLYLPIIVQFLYIPIIFSENKEEVNSNIEE